MPEFKAPQFREIQAAVAGSSASSAATAVADASSGAAAAPGDQPPPPGDEPAAPGETAVAEPSTSGIEIQWLWGQGKPETMHPFWAVRRLTAEQLDTEQRACIKRNKTAVASKTEKVPNFNCEFQEQVQSAVSVCTVGGAVANCTRLVKVPVLTNSTALAPGDELILELTIEAKEKTPTKRTWRDVDKEEATDRKRRRDLRITGTPDLAASRRESDWLSGPP